MQFALISLIILPVLPDRTFGPFNVLNPRNIWLMVVLIVGISLIGYIAYKFFDANTGVILGGILGGLVSSTATTVSNARQSRENDSLVRVAAIVITIATTILYFRVLVEVFAVAPAFLRTAAPPILILGFLLAGAAAWLWFGGRKEKVAVPQHGNPSELKSALVFALIYAFVLLAVAAVKEWYGDRGLFVVAILSGLTDVDAITLSVSRLVSSDRLGTSEAWRLIVTASLANLIFKVLVVAFIGHRNLLKTIADSIRFGSYRRHTLDNTLAVSPYANVRCCYPPIAALTASTMRFSSISLRADSICGYIKVSEPMNGILERISS